jgi:predicted transcriptional regulator
MTDRVRLTIDLSSRLNETIERIAREKDTSKADVLRFAIEFLEAANNARNDGMQVGAWRYRPDGTRCEREFIGL